MDVMDLADTVNDIWLCTPYGRDSLIMSLIFVRDETGWSHSQARDFVEWAQRTG
jgi:hypothetical protein